MNARAYVVRVYSSGPLGEESEGEAIYAGGGVFDGPEGWGEAFCVDLERAIRRGRTEFFHYGTRYRWALA